MKKDTRKINKDKRKFRIALFFILLILGSIFIPTLCELIDVLIKTPNMIFTQDTDINIIESWKRVLNEKRLRDLFYILEGLLLVGIFYLIYNPRAAIQGKGRSTKYGPAVAGQGEHGNAQLLDASEADRDFDLWFTDKEPNNVGLVYGMEKRGMREKVWTCNDDVHNLLIGATGTGKSRRVFIPSIWSIGKTGESMVITDPKGELHLATGSYLKDQGYNVITINLRNNDVSNTFNPMHRINKIIREGGDIAKAERYARDVAEAIVNQNLGKSVGGDPFWINASKGIITSLIMFVAMEADEEEFKNLRNVYYILGRYGKEDSDTGKVPLDEIMQRLNDHPAGMAWMSASMATDRTKTSMFTTALNDLQLFADMNVAKITCTQDHEFSDIVEKPTAVFLIIPDEITVYNIIATLYVDQLYQEIIEEANKTGNRINRRLNFLLDEFGNLPKIPEFDKKLTIARGRGIRFTIAVQDFQQIYAKYRDETSTIKGNCHFWLYLRTADFNTAKEISSKTGKYTIMQQSEGASIQGEKLQSSSSSNLSLTGRDVLMPDQILRWGPEDGALVLQMGKNAARLPLPDLSEYRANKELGLGNKQHNQNVFIERERMQQRMNHTIPQVWLPSLDFLDSYDEFETIDDPEIYNPAHGQKRSAISRVLGDNH